MFSFIFLMIGFVFGYLFRRQQRRIMDWFNKEDKPSKKSKSGHNNQGDGEA